MHKSLDAADLARDTGASHRSIADTIKHVVQADSIWLSRVSGAGLNSLHEWGQASGIEEIGAQWNGVLKSWEDWVGSRSGNWDYCVKYSNSQGSEFDTPLNEIILHLVNHETYHRGQLVSMMRQLGVPPPATDLILYYRERSARKATPGPAS